MKIQKNMVSMITLSIALIACILFMPENKSVVSVAVLVLGVFFALNYRKYILLYFVLILLVYTNFCSLVSSISTGSFPIDFELAIVAAGGIILLLTAKKDIKMLYPIILLLFVLMTSAVVAKLKYGQPIYMGLIAVIKKWFPLLIIPALARYIRECKNPYIILQYIVKLSLLVCAILCLQFYVLGDKYALLDLSFKIRYSGESGFLIHLISPVFLICLAIILLKAKKECSDWVAVFIIMFTLITVAKTRIFMFSACVIIIYCIFFYSRKISLVSKLGIVFIAGALIIPLIPTIVQMITKTFFSEILIKGDDYVRFQEIAWFNQENVSPKWLGIGVENRAYSGSPFLAGVENLRYYVSDIGIIGMFFQYGIQGIMVFAFYFMKMRRLVNEKLGYYEQGLFNCLIIAILSTSFSVSPVQFIIPIIIVFSLIVGLRDRSSLPEEECRK